LAAPPEAGTIAVTTQVVEAGVDVSAKTLFTELAPWASLVQRFGRSNRRGEFNDNGGAQVFWIDLPDDSKSQQKLAAPYALPELHETRKAIAKCQDVSPRSLEAIPVPLKLEADHILRRRDFIDLFDTTPDLSGNDIDVSRFIRSGEELDVHVFWRDVPKDVRQPVTKADYATAPQRDELCAVPVLEFRDFLNKHRSDVWRWDGLEGRWVSVDDERVFPGQTFLVRAGTGGYNTEIGWDGKEKKAVTPIPPSPSTPEAIGSALSRSGKRWPNTRMSFAGPSSNCWSNWVLTLNSPTSCCLRRAGTTTEKLTRFSRGRFQMPRLSAGVRVLFGPKRPEFGNGKAFPPRVGFGPGASGPAP